MELGVNYRTDLFYLLFLKILNMPTKFELQNCNRKNTMTGEVSKQPHLSLPAFSKLKKCVADVANTLQTHWSLAEKFFCCKDQLLMIAKFNSSKNCFLLVAKIASSS